MTVKEKPMDHKAIMSDTNTIKRLKILANGRPVASYLRELSTNLLKNEPIPLEELTGGESVTLLRSQLTNVLKRLGKIENDLDTSLDIIKEALQTLLKRTDWLSIAIQNEQDNTDRNNLFLAKHIPGYHDHLMMNDGSYASFVNFETIDRLNELEDEDAD